MKKNQYGCFWTKDSVLFFFNCKGIAEEEFGEEGGHEGGLSKWHQGKTIEICQMWSRKVFP